MVVVIEVVMEARVLSQRIPECLHRRVSRIIRMYGSREIICIADTGSGGEERIVRRAANSRGWSRGLLGLRSQELTSDNECGREQALCLKLTRPVHLHRHRCRGAHNQQRQCDDLKMRCGDGMSLSSRVDR